MEKDSTQPHSPARRGVKGQLHEAESYDLLHFSFASLHPTADPKGRHWHGLQQSDTASRLRITARAIRLTEGGQSGCALLASCPKAVRAPADRLAEKHAKATSTL